MGEEGERERKGGRKGGLNRSKSGPGSSSIGGSRPGIRKVRDKAYKAWGLKKGLEPGTKTWEAAIGFEPKKHPRSRC